MTAATEAAWAAYHAMTASKDAYFAALGAAQAAAREQPPRLAAGAHQAQLLAHHDACVKDFAHAMRVLADTDSAAHTTVLRAIGEINRDLGGPEGAA